MLFSLMRSWQLVLLSLTTVALSIASGWTTWDGMSNFTQAPLLSFLITFGIQVIMLVTAWRIGEEFANRPRDAAAPAQRHTPRTDYKWALVAAVTGIGAALLQVVPERLQTPLPTPAWTDAVLWPAEAPLLGTSGWASLALAIALVFAALAALHMLVSLAASFRTSLQFVTRNFIIMGMFLACMATSVFFSFDSLFAIVFPQAERARAAELRALSRAGELVSGIATTNEKQRFAERRALLSGPEWRSYAAGLERVSNAIKSGAQNLAKSVDEEIADADRKDLELKQQLTRLEVERKQKQQDRDTLQATRDAKRDKLNQLQDQAGKREQDLTQKRESIVAKRTEAKAEEIGAGTTGQIGKGPKYSSIIREISLLNLAISQAEAQAKASAREIAALTSEVAQLDKQLNEAIIRVTDLDNRLSIQKDRSNGVTDGATKATTIAKLTEDRTILARVKDEFEKTQGREQILALQSACSSSITRLKEAGQPAPADEACNASRLLEAAAQLFVLDAAAQTLKAKCSPQPVNGAQTAGFDQSLHRARACLELSGLPSTASARILADIDALERNRDDRAHRFVVTINAAQDGNRLAYLALALAFGIDGLVFFAGVLGANATRSSLATLPRPWSFNIRRAEEGLRNALAPDALHTARAALRVTRPLDPPRPQSAPGTNSVTPDTAAAASAWSHIIDLQDPHLTIAHDVRRLVNTAATIGAARRRPGTADAYELRAELIAFLNEIPLPKEAGPQRPRDPLDHGGMIAAALAPDVRHGASVVVTYMTPSSEEPGYTSEMRLDKVRAEHELLVQRFVNAASAAGGVIVVVGEETGTRRILLHEQVCRVVVTLAAPPRAPQPRPVAEIVPPLATNPATIPTATSANNDRRDEREAGRAAGEALHPAHAPSRIVVSAPAQAPPSQSQHTRAHIVPGSQLPRDVQITAAPLKSAPEPIAQGQKSSPNNVGTDPQPEPGTQVLEVARAPAREGERTTPLRIAIHGDTISFSDAD